MTQTTCCGMDCRNKLCTQQIPLFSSLDQDKLAQLPTIARHRQYPKGEILIREGETLDSLVVLNHGSAKAYKLTPDGREQILYVFAQGDFFGERNLLGSHKSPYTVEALENSRTCHFAKSDFYDLLRSNPDLAIQVIQELELRMERMENALQSMGVRSVDGRIGTLLLDFADKYGTQVPEGILLRLPLSREGMANFLGIARETMSRKLGQLESDGVLRSVSNKSLLILDPEALRAFSGKTS